MSPEDRLGGGYESPYLNRIRNLNVYRRGDRRAPHKPLLLLAAIARLLRGERDLPFAEVESILNPLLARYAPPVQGRHQPELPYWHLRSDGLWEIPGADGFPLQVGDFPRMAALRASFGRLPDGFADALRASPVLLRAVVETLLEEYFPESIQGDICDAVGLTWPQAESVADSADDLAPPRRRDPKFRQTVLRAYEHRCAVTGFRAALGGQYLGCEAAHVQWHAYQGPDTVDNGLAVEPTLHKLFDVGIWSLTDDRRIIVSRDFTGTDATVERIRGLHGKQIREPVAGEPPLRVDYIRWHREPDLGGVFKGPALAM